MRRLAFIPLGAALALVLAIAAPALSLRPYRPAPVDFELAPAGVAGRAASAPLVSPPLRTPKRFDLVGFRWRGGAEPAIAVRTRRAGEAWSRWVDVGAHADHAPDPGLGERSATGHSDPVWSGGADWVQYRMSRGVPGLRLHFVNTTGTATAADRLRTEVRGAAGKAVAFVFGPVVAEAQSQPEIVPRAAWGADQCPPRDSPSYGEVKAALVHHTVSTNDYLPEQGAAQVLAICRYHRNSNGWDDIGYNFLVDKYGRIYEGRAGGIDRTVVGAQAQGFNSQTTGIANMGTHTEVPQTDAALNAMAALIRWKLPLHGAPTAGTVTLTSGGGGANRHPAGAQVPFERVSGHRDAGRTACPGDALYGQLPDLRARVGGVAPGPQAARTRIRASASPRRLTFPGPIVMRGLLRRITGEAVSGAPVQVEHRGPQGWLPIATGHTESDGSFAVEASPAFSGLLRVTFPGGEALRSTASRSTTVRVRPAIEARRSVKRARVGQTPLVEGSVQPPRSRLVIVVERRVGRRNVRVARMKVRTREGRFAKAYRLRHPGLYRFRAVFSGDRLNLPGSSRAFYVRALPSDGGATAR